MATTRKQGRPKSEEKYHLILHAASCLFLKEGFANTSMDTVAKASGVSKQTVYSHFEGKDALFKAAISSDFSLPIIKLFFLITGHLLKRFLIIKFPGFL